MQLKIPYQQIVIDIVLHCSLNHFHLRRLTTSFPCLFLHILAAIEGLISKEIMFLGLYAFN